MAFALSPKLVVTFCVLRWHNELAIENLKFRSQGSRWVCIFLCGSCVASYFKLENPRRNQNQEPQTEQNQSGMFLRHWKCHRPYGKTQKGAQIYPGRVPFLPGRVDFHGILGGLVAPENILHPDLLKHHQRETQSRSREGCRICRQAGSFLVGLGKLNLACGAWQTRNWGETQSQHCGCGAGSSCKLTRNKFRLETQEVCHMTRSSSFLGLWPLSFLWAKLSLIGLGGFIGPWGLGLQLLVFLSPCSSARGHVPQDWSFITGRLVI